MISDRNEKRHEPRTKVDKYYSVELSIPDASLRYQFKIWNLSSKGICIVVKKDSDLLKHLEVGNILNMKYYPADSPYPTEYLKTQIKHITKSRRGRFRNHVLVGLFILEKQGETDMGDKGKKDKGKREQQKKAVLSPKEKRKLKKEKKK